MLLVAEVAQAHDGSLGIAHSYIDAAAEAGADAVKFQTHIAAEESTAKEPWRVRFSPQDETRFEYWSRLQWSLEQWRALKEHADERGLLFLSSPFSVRAVEWLSEIGIQGWKIASGELMHEALVDRIHQTGKPVLISTGMSDWSDLDVIVARFADRPAALLQCTTSYPCPPEEIGLNLLAEIRQRYPNVAVGLSDHSGTIFPGLAAATLGCDLLEVHVTFDRRLFGPDTSSSVTFEDLSRLAQGIRFIERLRENPVDKDRSAKSRVELKRVFGRSLVAARDLPRGHRLSPGDLIAKKPGGGLPPVAETGLLGRQLARPLAADELVALEDLE